MRRPRDLWTIIRAFFIFHWYDMKLRRHPFENLYDEAIGREKDDRESPLAALDSEEASRKIETLQLSARIIRRFDLRTRPDCLPRSLMMHHLLWESGIPASLRLGVKTAPFAAHAWVEVNGETVSDYGHESKFYEDLEAPAHESEEVAA